MHRAPRAAVAGAARELAYPRRLAGGGGSHGCVGRQAGVKLAIVRSGSQNAFIDATRPSSSTT